MTSCPIFCILLALAAASCAVLTRSKCESFLFPLICAAVGILFPFYCADQLAAGTVFLGVAWLLLVVAAVRKVCLSRVQINWGTYLLTPGMAAFAFLCGACMLISVGKQVCHWDEYRLWGAVPKALHMTQRLQLGAKASVFSEMQTYPPGMALYIYLVSLFSEEFYDSSIYFGYALFGCCALLNIFSGCNRKQKLTTIPLTICILVLPAVFYTHGDDGSYYYASLFIDPILGICVGNLLWQASCLSVERTASRLSFAASLCMLVLLKSTGLLFVISVLLLAWHHAAGHRRSVLISALPAAAAWSLWQILLHVNQAESLQQICFSSEALAGLPQLLKTVFTQPMTAWPSSLPIWLSPSLAVCIVTLLCTDAIISYFTPGTSRKQWLVDMTIWLCTILLFLIGYYLIYWESFDSFSRYMGAPLTAWLIVLFLRLPESRLPIPHLPGVSSAALVFCEVLLVVIVFCGFSLYNQKIYTWYDENPGQADVDFLLQSPVFSSCTSADPARIYLVTNGEDITHHRIYYALLGTNVNIHNYYFDSSLPSYYIRTPSAWVQHILDGGYEFVYIYDETGIDPEFVSLFPEIARGMLYSVDDTNGTFHPVS